MNATLVPIPASDGYIDCQLCIVNNTPVNGKMPPKQRARWEDPVTGQFYCTMHLSEAAKDRENILAARAAREESRR